MKSTSRSIRGVVGLIAATALFAMPGFAAAETASVMTRQVLPQGGNSCAPVFVSDVKTFVYDSELQSFEIVISDPAYVGLFGMAGDVAIPFNYMSRRIEPNGALRLHVDTTVGVSSAIPVTVTLLSSLPGQPTCITTVTFTANGDGSVTTENPTTTPVPGTSTGGSHSNSQGSVKGSSTTGSGKTITGTTSSTSTSIGETIAKMCSENGAYQLWFILLAIFFVIAAFVGLSQPPLSEKHSALPSALIGVPLVILLGFWYFVPDCRLNWFIPVILLVAAAIGIYSAYRTTPTVTGRGNSAVMILPPKDPKKGE